MGERIKKNSKHQITAQECPGADHNPRFRHQQMLLLFPVISADDSCQCC